MQNDHPSHAAAPSPGSGFVKFAHVYGLHPLVAFALVAIDWMLFTGLEIPSLGALAAVSALVAAALFPPCVLVQRYAYGDSWGAAIGKSALGSLITAIPTGLPSALTGGLGVLGAIGMKARPSEPRTVDMRDH
jgi:hypothetical protein